MSDGNDSNWVPFYCSDSEGELEEIETEVEVTPKRNSKFKEWEFKKVFPNKQEADLFLQNEKIWSLFMKKNTKDGLKKYFRCNLAPSKGPRCAAQLYLLFDAFSDKVLLFRTDSAHDHQDKPQLNHGLSEIVKVEINKLDINLTPKQVLTELTKLDKLKDVRPKPTLKKVISYVHNRRRMLEAENTKFLEELSDWFKNRSEVPEEEHHVFVISHECGGPNSFRFVLSTKYLLRKTTNARIIHADTSNRLIWHGLPVLEVGATDSDKTFHPLALSVATSEEAEDFQFIFSAIKKGISRLSDGLIDYQAEVLVCDGLEAIKNGFIEVFGESVCIRMCWALAKRKIKEDIEQFASEENKKELENDVDFLHSITNSDLFDVACNYFKRKWEIEPLFLESFEEKWLTENRGWYLGFHRGSPASNHALQSYPNLLKDEKRKKERHPLSRFLKIASDMVKEWSLVKNPLTLTPTIPLSLWTKAYQWARKPKNIFNYNFNEEFNHYVIPGGEYNEIRTESVECDTFEEVKEQYFREWEVALPVNKNWTGGHCNCPEFFAEYVCKHLVGMALRLKLAVAPSDAKTLTQDQNRKRALPLSPNVPSKKK